MYHLWQREDGSKGPYAAAGDPSHKMLALVPEVGGSCQGHIPINAEAGEKENTAVHVGKVKIVGEATEEISPKPSVIKHDFQHPDW